MPTPSERGQQIAAITDRLSSSFVNELKIILRDMDRRLRTLVLEETTGAALTASRVLVLKRQLRELLRRTGYDLLAFTAVDAGVEAFVASYVGAHGEAARELIASAAGRLDAMRMLALQDLLGKGDEVATALWRSVMQATFTGRPVSDILADLDSALDVGEGRIGTLFDTEMSIYGRAVEAVGAEDLPDDQLFRYVGPNDSKTREFCAEWIDKELTRDEIDELDNEQLPDVFLTAGGYNCRHSWIAVERESGTLTS